MVKSKTISLTSENTILQCGNVKLHTDAYFHPEIGITVIRVGFINKMRYFFLVVGFMSAHNPCG